MIAAPTISVARIRRSCLSRNPRCTVHLRRFRNSGADVRPSLRQWSAVASRNYPEIFYRLLEMKARCNLSGHHGKSNSICWIPIWYRLGTIWPGAPVARRLTGLPRSIIGGRPHFDAVAWPSFRKTCLRTSLYQCPSSVLLVSTHPTE